VSKVVDMKEVNELYKEYSQFANETITQLTELQHSIEQFQQLEGFTGQAAASAKAYMGEVHGAMIQSFMLVISDIQVTFMNMIQQFENSVDNNKEAIIHTDHFINLKTSFRQHNHQFLDIHHDIHQTIQKVSDIVSLSQPDPTRVEEMYYNVNVEISNRDLDVEAFDSMNRDKMNASSDLIQSIMNSMNEIKASISTPSGIRYALGDITTSSWGQRLGDTAAPVSKQLTEQLEEMKENAEIAKANAPEERNGFIDFLGEMFFVYDIKRLVTGEDPITHEKLSAFEMGLAAAGFIPISKFTKLGKLGKVGDDVLDAGKGVDEGELLDNIKNVAKENSPAKLAQSWQGSGRYPGIDKYRDITLKEGKVIYRGEPYGSEYFTTASAIKRSNNDATKLFEGLQVQKHDIYGFKSEVQSYVVTKDVKAAFGVTKANPQYGSGGLPQVFVPNIKQLIEEGILTPVEKIKLSNFK
jgi:LXG domain of WXG superfamily/Pre-toxin TG